MNVLRFLKGAAVAVAGLGLALPPLDLLAAEPAPAVAPAVTDVALSAGGSVTGQVVDNQGNPVDGAVVTFAQGEQKIAETVADADGVFGVSGLRGGVYNVAAGPAVGTYRLWAPNTAPPAAQEQILLVQDPDAVARGQFGHAWDVPTLLTLGISIAALTVAVVTLDRVNDVRRDVRRISP